MKGIVVDVKNNKTVVLGDNGEFIKLNHVYNVGETIDIPSRSQISHLRRNLISVAAALVIFLGAGTIYAANTPYSYVTLDVNPSVEYEVNIFNHVIKTKALNDDGKVIVKSLKNNEIKGNTVTEALNKSLKAIKDKGYINTTKKDYAIVSVVSKDEDVTSSISGDVVKELKKDTTSNITVDVVKGTIDDRETAAKLNISTGRLQVAKAITGATDEDILKDSSAAQAIVNTGTKTVDSLVKTVEQRHSQAASEGTTKDTQQSSSDSKTTKNTEKANTNSSQTNDGESSVGSGNTSNSSSSNNGNGKNKNNKNKDKDKSGSTKGGGDPGILVQPDKEKPRGSSGDTTSDNQDGTGDIAVSTDSDSTESSPETEPAGETETGGIEETGGESGSGQ